MRRFAMGYLNAFDLLDRPDLLSGMASYLTGQDVVVRTHNESVANCTVDGSSKVRRIKIPNKEKLAEIGIDSEATLRGLQDHENAHAIYTTHVPRAAACSGLQKVVFNIIEDWRVEMAYANNTNAPGVKANLEALRQYSIKVSKRHAAGLAVICSDPTMIAVSAFGFAVINTPKDEATKQTLLGAANEFISCCGLEEGLAGVVAGKVAAAMDVLFGVRGKSNKLAELKSTSEAFSLSGKVYAALAGDKNKPNNDRQDSQDCDEPKPQNDGDESSESQGHGVSPEQNERGEDQTQESGQQHGEEQQQRNQYEMGVPLTPHDFIDKELESFYAECEEDMKREKEASANRVAESGLVYPVYHERASEWFNKHHNVKITAQHWLNLAEPFDIRQLAACVLNHEIGSSEEERKLRLWAKGVEDEVNKIVRVYRCVLCAVC